MRKKALVNADLKAILFFGVGASVDAGTFEPSDPTHFGVGVQILVGEEGSDLTDSFDITVCSPSSDWGSVASRLGRQLPWEFDYKYDAHLDSRLGEAFPPSKV